MTSRISICKFRFYMLQLTIEAFDTVFSKSASLSFDEFQPIYILVFGAVWLLIKLVLDQFASNSTRIIGMMHACAMVLIGFPVIAILCSTSFAYVDMYESFLSNGKEIIAICNIVTYTSIGYFLMDSYFIVKRAYLKHHIFTIIAWLASSFHHETSLVHGTAAIALFEMGAVIVQLSRVFPNVVLFRFFVCCGYTATRVALTYYFGFIVFTAIQFWYEIPLFVQLGYVPILSSLVFLLALNAKWTFLQWKAFSNVLRSNNASIDFYSFHQKLIGNTNTVNG